MPKVAFLWHMHQPFYRDPVNGKMLMPWVRLHGIKDYLDMPLRVGHYDRLRMTFNLVPSLVEQLQLYVDRKTTDRQLELTVKPAASLTHEEKTEIFESFFALHPATMIKPFPRFDYLYQKLQHCNGDPSLASRTASVEEIRDLTVWYNLAWIDPAFRNEPQLARLYEKGKRFTEDDKRELIEAQYGILERVIPSYKALQDDARIEVSFSPFFHPILPLLCDTESAKEAMPNITLPKYRFCHPEDAIRQVSLAIEMYESLFGRKLKGMWPSEGSICETTADILAERGLNWMASDERVLSASMVKAGHQPQANAHYNVFRYKARSGDIHVIFRDHGLSDRIGFVYSGWDEEKAVDDLLGNIRRIGAERGGQDDPIIPIILDGENCWEYYKDDGEAFLSILFDKLEKDATIETVTMSAAVASSKPRALDRLAAGSWINRNFRIWIGHPEDNSAWDLLWEARHALVNFREEHPNYDAGKLTDAEKAILVAEGSDWNWWYGDEHVGPYNALFDQIYRAHLGSVYSMLGLEIPERLQIPISAQVPETFTTEPEGTVTPILDGRLTHYYEWLGAGHFDCRKAGGAMHRVDRLISDIYYVSDADHIYLRVDFDEKSYLVGHTDHQLMVEIHSPGKGKFVFAPDRVISIPDWAERMDGVRFGIGEIAEIGLAKRMFFPNGVGEVLFKVGLVAGTAEVELWPMTTPIRFAFARKGEEIIWDL